MPVEIVVADNGSGEGCRDVAGEFPEVKRLPLGTNLGFGPALNRAIETFGEGPVILLNDDAIAEPDFVERLLETWAGETSMVAGVMLSADGESIDSAGVVADVTLAAHDHLNGEPLSALENAETPFGPTGGGALYDRRAFEAVGGFDERIFLYYEDLDLALRIKVDGGTCRLATRARARHGYSETLGARSGRKYGFTGWSRGYLLRRYGIMRNPLRAAQVLLMETAVCLAQLAFDRTTQGVTGRVRGWRAARGLEPRPLPRSGLSPAAPLQALRLKFTRRTS